LDEAAVLSSDAEKYLRYYAMDVIMLGSRQNRSEMISCIARRLTDVDEFIAARAVELLARASETQLASSKVLFEAQNEIDHATGMSKITNSSAFNEDAIEAMMKSESVLERRYGLVAAKRAQKINSNLLKQAALSDDPVLARIGRAV